MLDGFWNLSKFDARTNKQKLESRIKESVLNLVINRDQSFLKTARKNNTSIIVNSRDGGIQKFKSNGRDYISLPHTLEDTLSELDDVESEELLTNILKNVTVDNENKYDESTCCNMIQDNEDIYKKYTGESTGLDIEKYKDLYEYKAISGDEAKEQVEEGESGTSGSSSISSYGNEESSDGSDSSEIGIKENEGIKEYTFKDVDLNPDYKMNKDFEDKYFYNKSRRFSKERRIKLHSLSNTLLKSFKGRISKQQTIVPNKRIKSRSLCRDDLKYINKKGNNGKHLYINFIIDCSGSMHGTPMNNAVDMAYIFNEIALGKHLEGNIIYSNDYGRRVVPLPAPRDFIIKMSKAGGGAEYIEDAINENIELLKKADVNICLTDGNITDSPIVKSNYEKHGIEIMGVYVNKNAKDLTEYTGSLSKWFSKSLVRNTVEDLVNKIVQLGLRRKR